jgi:hypothetical protein
MLTVSRTHMLNHPTVSRTHIRSPSYLFFLYLSSLLRLSKNQWIERATGMLGWEVYYYGN